MRKFFAGFCAAALLLAQGASAQGYIPPAGSGGTPGGTTGQVQYNNAGAFGGLALGDLTNNSGTLNVTGLNGSTLSTYFASPPIIGATTPAAGTFSSLKDAGVTGSTQCLHVDATGAVTGFGADCGAALASMASNSVLANFTGGSATPIANSVPSCSGAANALIYTTATGFGCNSISGSNPFPAYKSGNWYSPLAVVLNAGVVKVSGSVYCVPWLVQNSMTVKAFAVKITTATGTGTNSVAIGLFAPTGAGAYPATSPLVTASTTLGTGTGFITATPGSPVAVSAGMYWACVQTNDTTVIFQGVGYLMGWSAGFATVGNLIPGTNNVTGYIAQTGTYGTWPTNGSWSTANEASSVNHGVFVGIQEN